VCGGTIRGHVRMNGSVNVIVRNLFVVGNDCKDNPDDCSGGEDAITVQQGSHHLWFDHDDISDGSDGNLDITHGSDYVTISWTRFHYSHARVDPAGASGGHRFSNLIGHSDKNSSEDQGHLRITFHHDHWGAHVVERMPRVRFGQVHLFDNLYTTTESDYCVGLGVGASILTENNVFAGVKNPIDSTSYSDSASVVVSHGNLYPGSTGSTADKGTSVFKPGYTYTLDPASGVQAAVMAGVGPH
jgi:pectate lyase